MKPAENYLKAISQLIFTVLAAVAAAAADDRIDSTEWVNVLILTLGTVSVLGAGNMPEGIWKRTKLIVSAATAAAVVLHTFISSGVDLGVTEWIQMALAAAASFGVYAVKGPEVISAPRRGKHAAKE